MASFISDQSSSVCLKAISTNSCAHRRRLAPSRLPLYFILSLFFLSYFCQPISSFSIFVIIFLSLYCFPCSLSLLLLPIIFPFSENTFLFTETAVQSGAETLIFLNNKHCMNRKLYVHSETRQGYLYLFLSFTQSMQ